MAVKIDSYDTWITHPGPAALVLRQQLESVDGKDGVIFPATFAPAKNAKEFPGGYNINEFPDGTNICLIDSVGSQANRIEPLFAQSEYASLVPQVAITAGDRTVSLLEAGHRAGDAIVRCSSLQGVLRKAFLSAQAGECAPMAKIAPTSLVFGVWDSRDTQVKLPRIITSTIRAFNVRKLTRSAQFNPAVPYVDNGLLADPDGDEKIAESYAKRGFIHVPATNSHGGVIATGGVRRDANLSLAALRLLRSTPDTEGKLRRYILGLALVALTAPQNTYLRAGCNLVPDPSQPLEFFLVHGNGQREMVSLRHEECLDYASLAAIDFTVGEQQNVSFDKNAALEDLANDEKKGKSKGKGKGKGKSKASEENAP